MQIPFNSIEVKNTCLGIIRESAKFIKSQKELVKKLFAFLIQNFNIPYIKSKVLQAFSKMCSHNSDFVLENINDFLASFIFNLS